MSAPKDVQSSHLQEIDAVRLAMNNFIAFMNTF